MAWYDITYACGHEGREQIYGPVKNRQWIADRKAEKLCPDCYAADLAAQREAENRESAEKAKEEGLPALVGTEKQVAYGETCRVKLMEALERLFENQQILERWKNDGHDHEDITNAFASLTQKASAAWWIETKREVQTELDGYKLLEKFIPPKDTPLITADEKAAIEAETTVYPENPKTKTVATIFTDGEKLVIKFPERREDFRLLMREKMNMTWRDRWERAITEFNSPVEDRIIEAGHVLLAYGFAVRIADRTWRERAIAGDFTPEQTRWIYESENRVGLISILWDRKTEDYYKVARRLPTSRWSSPVVTVQPSAYEEVEDFARKYDFTIHPSAQKLLGSARLAHESALKVKVEEKTREFEKPSTKPQDLVVPEEVVIDEEFRDDD